MGAFDGNGNFVRSYSWVQDASNNINITASRVDTEDNGYATGLSLCVTRDGQGKMAADFLPATTASYNLGTGTKQWLAISALSGAIGPPASGVAWTVTAAASNYAAKFISSSGASGTEFGLQILAGVTASDIALSVQNHANSANYFQVGGAGSIQVGQPVGGDQGAGTINLASGIFVNAAPLFPGIPQNSQSAAYTTVLADANKHIYHPSADTTARTWTIDSNANVPYPIGTAITFDNDGSAGIITLAITTDTLVWLPSGGTGSRAIAPFGQGTALKVTATRWHLTGVGIT